MRLTRRLSILIVGFLLGGFLLSTFILISLESKKSNPEDPDDDVADLSASKLSTQPARNDSSKFDEDINSQPTGTVVLTNFHRTQTKDNGEKDWEITAELGEYLPEVGKIKITRGLLTMFKKENSQTKLFAPTAIIETDGTNLKKAICSGGVRLEQDGKITVSTDSLTFLKDSGEISSNSRVTIESEAGVTSGDTLIGDTNSRVFTLSGAVQTTIFPSGGNGDE